MKLNKLTLALLASAAAGQAYAYAPTDVYDYTVTISGASAQDDAVETIFTGGLAGVGATTLCTANVDVYSGILQSDGITKSKTDYRAISCQTTAAKIAGVADVNADGAIKILVLKRSEGGSALGVQPLARDKLIDQINLSTCTANAGTGVDLANKWSYNCTGLTTLKSDIGVSDVDPGIFRNVDNTPSAPGDVAAGVNFAMTTADVNRLQIKSAAALIFGVPVTLNFRNALQDAEVLNGKLAAICGGATATAANRDLESCMPNMSSKALASIFTGVLADWSQLGVTNLAMPASGDTAPKLCRRVSGSGTQATYNVKVLDNPCKGGAGATMASGDGFNVFENSATGDVRTCLNTQHAAGNYGVGLLSMENKPSATRNYRFIKLDGVSPSLKNAATGDYKIVVEQTWQWRKTGQTNALAGGKLAIANAIVANSANPAAIAVRNAGYTYGLLETGYLATLPNTASPTVPFSAALPVWGFSHQFNSQTLDNCRTPEAYDAATAIPGGGI